MLQSVLKLYVVTVQAQVHFSQQVLLIRMKKQGNKRTRIILLLNRIFGKH